MSDSDRFVSNSGGPVSNNAVLELAADVIHAASHPARRGNVALIQYWLQSSPGFKLNDYHSRLLAEAANQAVMQKKLLSTSPQWQYLVATLQEVSVLCSRTENARRSVVLPTQRSSSPVHVAR